MKDLKAWLERNTKEKRDVTCCWFDQKPINRQFDSLKQLPPFTWRSEQIMIEFLSGYICYLIDEDGIPNDKEAIITN